jgi:hypothetical protein
VQLLMTVKKGQSLVVGNKVKRQRLKPAQHHDILDHAGSGLAADVRQSSAAATAGWPLEGLHGMTCVRA